MSVMQCVAQFCLRQLRLVDVRVTTDDFVLTEDPAPLPDHQAPPQTSGVGLGAIRPTLLQV